MVLKEQKRTKKKSRCNARLFFATLFQE